MGAVEWYWLDCFGQEHGPVTFARLAGLIADGEVDRDGLVRRRLDPERQRVGDVIGLLRAADARDSVCEDIGPAHSGSASTDSKPDFAQGHVLGSTRTSVRRIAVMTLAFGVVTWVAWILWRGSQRFPRPPHVKDDPEWSLPLLGPVSTLELSLICVDIVVVIAGGIWSARSRRSAKPQR